MSMGLIISNHRLVFEEGVEGGGGGGGNQFLKPLTLEPPWTALIDK